MINVYVYYLLVKQICFFLPRSFFSSPFVRFPLSKRCPFFISFSSIFGWFVCFFARIIVFLMLWAYIQYAQYNQKLLLNGCHDYSTCESLIYHVLLEKNNNQTSQSFFPRISFERWCKCGDQIKNFKSSFFSFFSQSKFSSNVVDLRWRKNV